MIIYNITLKVANSIKEEWLRWLTEEHIPEVIETGCFQKATLLRLLDVDDSEGPTYAVQYLANTIEDYENYLHDHADLMRQKSFDKWADQFIAFRTVMEVVN